jgi:hypothetical protein
VSAQRATCPWRINLFKSRSSSRTEMRLKVAVIAYSPHTSTDASHPRRRWISTRSNRINPVSCLTAWMSGPCTCALTSATSAASPVNFDYITHRTGINIAVSNILYRQKVLASLQSNKSAIQHHYRNCTQLVQWFRAQLHGIAAGNQLKIQQRTQTGHNYHQLVVV